MTEPTGYIIVHTRHNSIGKREQLRFEWQGGDTVAFSKELLQDSVIEVDGDLAVGSILRFGPFKLRIIEDQVWSKRVLAVRYDGVMNRIKYILHRATPLLDLSYRRLILTLVVWNLATHEPGRIPSWRDIHLAKWFKRD